MSYKEFIPELKKKIFVSHHAYERKDVRVDQPINDVVRSVARNLVDKRVRLEYSPIRDSYRLQTNYCIYILKLTEKNNIVVATILGLGARKRRAYHYKFITRKERILLLNKVTGLGMYEKLLDDPESIIEQQKMKYKKVAKQQMLNYALKKGVKDTNPSYISWETHEPGSQH